MASTPTWSARTPCSTVLRSPWAGWTRAPSRSTVTSPKVSSPKATVPVIGPAVSPPGPSGSVLPVDRPALVALGRVHLVPGRAVTVEHRLQLVLVLGVVVGLRELLGRRLLHVVGVPQRREPGPEPGASRGGCGDAVGVGGVTVRQLGELVPLARREGVGAGRVERQVPLAVAALGGPHDDAG